MTLACENTEAHGQFLNQVQDRHQHELQQQKPIAPLNPALGGGDDTADISIGEHHDKSRAKDRKGPFPTEPRSGRLTHHHTDHL